MNELRVAVAGHVDHGKSTIIGRLLYETGSLSQEVADRFDRSAGSRDGADLAFVTDQLSEEQEGSYTLDTAQAQLRAPGRDYTLIDTPGHREFLKNMVTGTTRAHAAVLVVDAAEGPLQQTYLHACLIEMLGIRQVIVAINKMDLVAYDRHRFQSLSRQLARHWERIALAPVATVPVSAQHGDHIVTRSDKMPWNRSPTLLEALDELTPPDERAGRPLRVLIQCPFPAGGRQTFMGKVISGTLQQGRTIVLGAQGHKTVTTSVMVGQQETRVAVAGQSVGLRLQDHVPVERGHVGFDEDNAPMFTDRFTARVFWISPGPLEVNAAIEVLCGTQHRRGHVEHIARVIDPASGDAVKTQAACLYDSQIAEVSIRTDCHICVDPFTPELGRFAILQAGRIVGGGVMANSQHVPP